jgi:hypothetical protein
MVTEMVTLFLQYFANGFANAFLGIKLKNLFFEAKLGSGTKLQNSFKINKIQRGFTIRRQPLYPTELQGHYQF